MNCTGKKIIFGGTGLGILIFILNTMFFSNAFLYYASGIWLGDLAARGKGEAGLLTALSVGLLACILTSVLYCFLACKLLSKRSKQ